MLSLLVLLAATGLALSESNRFLPARIIQGLTSSFQPETTAPIILNAAGQSVTLDYGHEVAGTPYFVVSDVDKPVQIEVRYSEEFRGLNEAFADGPFPFSVGLSSTFRTETFNVTTPGTIQSYFIQGGQRWQSITQLTEGSLVLAEAGLLASIDYSDVEDLPGHFECSNSAYNAIWNLGALASAASCLDAGSQNATWEITSDGALVHGQKPALSAIGMNFIDYTLGFRTKIVRGGTGWAIAQSSVSMGLQLLLVSELPEDTTFVNTNTTITPPNSLVLAYGYSFVNQTTLPSLYLDTFEVPFTVTEDTWYDIKTSLVNGTQLSVALNGTEIVSVSLESYGVTVRNNFRPTAPPGQGSWGFGPWQDQIALYKDVVVVAQNGTVIYENRLSSEDVLSEYGVATNNATVCLDGPKRDRLVWLGDAFHTTRIISASTARKDHVLGTLQYLFEWQNDEGRVPIAPHMGYDPRYAPQLGSYASLVDYQTLGLLSFTGYFHLTGDNDFARQLWPGFKKQITWLISQINSTTGLADISGFTGPASGTATSAALVQALNEAANVATALNDTDSAANYTSFASKLADAIDARLWNEALGVYVTSLSAPSNFSVADITFAITSGVAARNVTRINALLAALEELRLGPGYKDNTAVSSTDPATNISPNINGFLLSALMQVNATERGQFLFDNLWTAMIANEFTTTGTSWEYVNAHDLSPGLGLFTSLGHPWGGAPTYIMPQWIAGVRPVTPGYREWVVIPGIEGFNLSWASVRVPTEYGTISVRWEMADSTLCISISAPEGTSGTFELPNGKQLGTWSLNRQHRQGGSSIALGAGRSTVIVNLS